jgi:hypothetical protein
LPLSYQEILAYAVLSGIRPSPWEVEMLRALSREWLLHMAEAQKKKNPQSH